MSDITDDFLWKGFERLHPTSEDTDDDVVAQMERMLEPKFRREYTVFRISHFASRIVELEDDFQLPTNSILHIADNLEHLDDFIDTPRVDENRFVQKESFRKWIYHVRELNDKGPIQYEDKYILRMAGLPGKLLAFRSEHGNQFRYVNHISELPRKKESLIIINHNPLFRMRMYGRLQFFRKMQQIFASIFNTCCDLTFLNKRQFIFLPWGDEFYDRALFFRSRNVLNLATIKRPESLHYFLMMHILNFLWDTATTSMLKKLPEKVLEQLYIVPNIKGKYIFYNLKDLINLNEKNYAYRRVTNQLNLLAVLGRDGIDESHPQIKQLLEEAKVDEVVNEQPQESEKEDSEGTEVKETILPVSRLVPGIALDKKPKPVIEEDTSRIEDEIKEAAEETKASEDPTRPTTTIKGIASGSKNPPITAVSIEVPSAQAEIKTSSKQVSKVVNTDLILNTTKLDISRAHKEDTTEYIKDTEEAADEFIEEQEELTPRAKEHFKKLARKYENLEIDGEKIKNILEDSSDNTLSDSTLNKEQLGVVPDESALVSTLANFDKDYIKKTYKKHIAGTITSFQKQGVYLINVKTEPVVTDLHNYTLYTCQYEDIQGRKSTVKFKMPNVTSEGKITVDGVPNIVKKQRTTLPIVKISDTVVSLASNYNKTRVIRNTNKAHNFFSYIHSFVNDKEKSNITVGYGTHRLNLAISYEYTALAERYSTLDYKGTDNRKYSLTFDYYHRFDKFSGKPELLEKLEAQYGTYFGTASGAWLFIDVNNRVYAVKTSGGEDTEYPYTSLIDVLKLGCKEDIASKIKPLSEWVTIKILDLNIPVIFMLAYRYGLRKTLDYLGMKYTITENRSKTIVGENTAIAGVESYTPRTPDSNIYFYHVIPKNNTLKQDGLLSPYAMYHHRRDMFHQHTWSNYKKRAAEYLGKAESAITDEDIMKYLDTEPKRKAFTSKALFFSFVPADKLIVTHDNEYVQGCDEYCISLSDMIKYSVGRPIIVLGQTSLETTWDEVKRHYDDYCKQAVLGGKKPYKEFLYKYIKHIAVKFEDAIPAEVLQSVEAGMESLAYHITGEVTSSFKKHGLCSPRELLKLDRKAFHDHTYEIYSSRACEFFNKDKVTDDEIINYLDSTERSPFTADCVFFSMVPRDVGLTINKIPYISLNGVEFSVDLDVLQKYSIGDPVVVIAKERISMSWSAFKRDYNQLVEKAVEAGNKAHAVGKNSYLPYFGVPCKSIPFSALTMVSTVKGKGLVKGFNDATWITANRELGIESFGADSDNLYINGSVTPGVLDDDYTGVDDLIVGTENLKRPVKPKLGDVTLFVTDKGNTGDYDGRRVQVRAFIFTVKLGRSVSVVRRIHNYDSQTFVTNDIKSVSRDLVDKASEYLRCSKRKISKARLEFIPADKSIPPKVAKIPILTPVEYKKMTSKLNIDENKVRPPQHGTASWDVGMEDISEDIKYVPQPNDIHIRFADRVLHFNRYPLAHSLIVAGLANFDLSKYEMSELETKDAYFRILVDKKLSTNYLKGIDSFYDLFVDNMTYSVLKMMHEPTNVRDLLIRSTVLLTTTDHVSASSGTNHRIRGYEQFAAILYNEMSREFASYQARRGKANVFSINPDAVYLRIIQNASMVPAVTPSPLEDLKLTDAMTYAGVGGRTGESFVIEDRRFDASDVGIISEATADSGKVGMNAQLTFNPDITSTLGLIQDKDPSERTPSQTWSIHALTFPFATNDD